MAILIVYFVLGVVSVFWIALDDRKIDQKIQQADKGQKTRICTMKGGRK